MLSLISQARKLTKILDQGRWIDQDINEAKMATILGGGDRPDNLHIINFTFWENFPPHWIKQSNPSSPFNTATKPNRMTECHLENIFTMSL